MSDELHVSLTASGALRGVDAGTPWTFEPAGEHWRLHEQREVAYWRSRPPEERLGQALYYRVRAHGHLTAPTEWCWRFVAPDE